MAERKESTGKHKMSYTIQRKQIIAQQEIEDRQVRIMCDRNKPRQPRGEEHLSNARDAELREHLRRLRSSKSSGLILIYHSELEMESSHVNQSCV